MQGDDALRQMADGAEVCGPGWRPATKIEAAIGRLQAAGRKEAGPAGGADDAGPGGGAGAGPAMLSAAEFLAKWRAPDFIVDGVLQRGYLYSFCGKTGHGKTAVALLLAVGVAAGIPFAGHEVARGRVVYLAGENPDDVRTRLLIMGEVLGIDVAALDLHFVDGAFDLAASLDALTETITRIGGAQLVIVDTAAAHFRGDDENSNTELGGFARELRRICTMDGAPAVVVPAHPIKHASAKADLLPRGGGAFIAEVDGNLTCFSGDDGETAEVHWTGKIRGPSFEPFALRLEKRASALLKDAKGRPVRSVVAVPMTEDDLAKVQGAHVSEQDHLLETMLHYPKGSLADWCDRMGWLDANRAPLKSKIHRRVRELVEVKLASKVRGERYALTTKGRAEAERISGMRA